MNKDVKLQRIENFMECEKKIEENDKEWKKLMFIYELALKEMNMKFEMVKDEFKIFYDYNLIDHINTRIKATESIIKKMNDKELKSTYRNMVENINDIAGIRVICPMKEDIYTIRNIIANWQDIRILKEKDYVRNPKKSGYSSYHIILEVPVILSKTTIYVKVEVQIRTLAMDFWATIEHTMKYKSKAQIEKSKSKELIQCAKIINRLDNKMMMINT